MAKFHSLVIFSWDGIPKVKGKMRYIQRGNSCTMLQPPILNKNPVPTQIDTERIMKIFVYKNMKTRKSLRTDINTIPNYFKNGIESFFIMKKIVSNVLQYFKQPSLLHVLIWSNSILLTVKMYYLKQTHTIFAIF